MIRTDHRDGLAILELGHGKANALDLELCSRITEELRLLEVPSVRAVVMTVARYQGDRLIDWVESQLEGRFGLTINREKTRVVCLNQPGASVDFLGFTFRYDRDLYGHDRRYLNVFPSTKAQASSAPSNSRKRLSHAR